MQSYTTQQGRKFGLTVGGAFAVIAAISSWRGHQRAPLTLGAIAALLILAALAAPRSLESVERQWMKLAHLISRITTPIFMGIVYFGVLTPIGFLRRSLGKNALVHRPVDDSYWAKRLTIDAEKQRRRMERQF
jgi:hypothetical protein